MSVIEWPALVLESIDVFVAALTLSIVYKPGVAVTPGIPVADSADVSLELA